MVKMVARYKVIKIDESTYSLLKKLSGDLNLPMKEVVRLSTLMLFYVSNGDLSGFKKIAHMIMERQREERRKRIEILSTLGEEHNN